MRYVIAVAQDAGCYKVQLHSGKQRAAEAHEFYRRLGFEAVAEGFKLFNRLRKSIEPHAGLNIGGCGGEARAHGLIGKNRKMQRVRVIDVIDLTCDLRIAMWGASSRSPHPTHFLSNCG